MKLTKKELNEIIESHGKWLRGEEGGKRENRELIGRPAAATRLDIKH